MVNINDLKVDDKIKAFNDRTVFAGNDDYPFFRTFHPNSYLNESWNYKVRYCNSDYVILEILGEHLYTELYILNNYESIEIYNE